MFEELAGTEKYMKYIHDEGYQTRVQETQRNIIKNFAEMGMTPE